MSKNKIKPLDWMFMNKLDRKQSNKKQRSYKKIFDEMAKQQWFKNTYHNKSIGEVIPIDY